MTTAMTHGRAGRPWRRLREQVLREEPCCRYCQMRPSTVVDHILPLSRFPHLAHHRDNLAGSCAPCNGSKHNRAAPKPRRPPPSNDVTTLRW